MYPYNPDERDIYADSFDHDIKLDTKEGQRVVDFVQELAIENSYTPVVHQILSYLTPKDLTSCSCVNKSWNGVIKSDSKSSHRKKLYLNSLRERKERFGKENCLPSHYHVNDRTPVGTNNGGGENERPNLINRQKLFVKKKKKNKSTSSPPVLEKDGTLKTKKTRRKVTESLRPQITMFR